MSFLWPLQQTSGNEMNFIEKYGVQMLNQNLEDCARYFAKRFPNAPLDGNTLHLQSYYKINGDGKNHTFNDFRVALIQAREEE